MRIASPKGYEPNPLIVKKATQICNNKNLIKITNDLNAAVKGANVLYTDVWSSMGEESQKDSKDIAFKGFTIDKNLLNKANPNAIVYIVFLLIGAKRLLMKLLIVTIAGYLNRLKIDFMYSRQF